MDFFLRPKAPLLLILFVAISVLLFFTKMWLGDFDNLLFMYLYKFGTTAWVYIVLLWMFLTGNFLSAKMPMEIWFLSPMVFSIGMLVSAVETGAAFSKRLMISVRCNYL